MTDRWVTAHASPAGPGDSRPTARQIVEAEGLMGAWTGRNVLITGCSSGLGVEAAKALALTGATLYVTARKEERARAALKDLPAATDIHYLELDLNSLKDVRRFAEELTARVSKLDVFIANAGVMNTPEGRTEDGFETQFGTNHLAHFLLLHLLTPILKAAATQEHNARVVILSSIGHRFGSVHFDNYNLQGEYNPDVAYAQSKTANLWTALAYDRKMSSSGVRAWAVQPGGVQTPLMRHMDEKTKSQVLGDAYLQSIFKSPEQGAATEVWAACSKSLEGLGGQYLEDCQIIGEWKEGQPMMGPGYAAHAHDEEGQERLFKLSQELVGI